MLIQSSKHGAQGQHQAFKNEPKVLYLDKYICQFFSHFSNLRMKKCADLNGVFQEDTDMKL